MVLYQSESDFLDFDQCATNYRYFPITRKGSESRISIANNKISTLKEGVS